MNRMEPLVRCHPCSGVPGLGQLVPPTRDWLCPRPVPEDVLKLTGLPRWTKDGFVQRGLRRCRAGQPRSRGPSTQVLKSVLMLFLAMGLFSYPLEGWASARSAWPNSKEWGVYRAQLVGAQEPLWEVSWETTVKKGLKGIQVRIYEQGRGQPWGDPEPIVWEKEMLLEVDPEVRIKGFEGSRWDLQGALKSLAQMEVDPKRGRIVYEDTRWTRRRGEFPWVPNLIPKEFLFHWLRMLDFEKSPVGECLLLVAPTRRFRMTAQFQGVETVTTPAGTFSCFRLELSPELGPLKLLPIKSLIPKITLWCKKEEPHLWVRYTGPIGEPGSPSAVIELTSWKAR